MIERLLTSALLAGSALVNSTAIQTQVSAVTSKDGTTIAVECAGSGPTLLMVHGGTGDRTRWTPMFPFLSSQFTVCAMDRRGRGGSTDNPVYSLSKEAEDVAAVVDSRPGEVYVLGHSYGAVTSVEAAFLTKRIAKLLLYEPPFHDPADRNLAVAARMERMIAAGDREQATAVFLGEVVGLSSEALAEMKARPAWSGLVATIDQQVRQMHALAAYKFDGARVARLSQPVLLIVGGRTASPYLKQSIAELRRVLPHPALVTLEGQEHNAMDTAREPLARAIAEFLRK